MRALVRDVYGSPEVLHVAEIDKPDVADDGVLVRVRAVGINRQDWYFLTGTPLLARTQMGLRKPKERVLGTDFSGTVEAVGKHVTQFRPGDEVFGGRTAAFAEYVSIRIAVERKPANVTFEEAAAVPVAGITALQGLRDKGNVQRGQRVLINGASGGVGTFAVQIAKALGAEVTGVCSTRNVELVRSLGADHVIDYKRDDFTRSGNRYDLLFDNAGSGSLSEYSRVLMPEATVVIAGAQRGSRLLGPLGHVVKLRLAGIPRRRKVVFFIAQFNKPDMAVLRELLESGKVKPVVEKRYELADAADALSYMGEGHAQGKLVIGF